MADIFISHSKKDAETVAAFCNVFARTTIRAILAEFEAYAIRGCRSSVRGICVADAVQTGAINGNLNGVRIGFHIERRSC
jgi:hypothetical protein